MKLNKNSILINFKYILSRWGFSKKGLFMNSKGEWYLFSQILLILLHLIPPYPKIENIPLSINIFFIVVGLTISIQGIIITIKAFIDLGDNLSPLPYPIEDSNLIKHKSYKNTRHPLYKGLLLISFGISIFTFSLIHLLLLLLLANTLKIKALKEEEKLKYKFPEYKKYIEDTPAIIKQIRYLDWRS